MDAVALASVVSSAIVGIAGVAVPAIVRKGDREHEKAVRIRDRRAEAYSHVLGLMQDVLRFDVEAATGNNARHAATFVWLWGSSEVRGHFEEWLKILPTAYGPKATDADRQRVLEAANAVRTRIGDEVQGRTKIG